MAVSNFFVQDGLNVNNYITANSTTLKVGTNTTINSTAIRIGNAVGFALGANGDSLGSNGFYLTSNGTTVFWSAVSGGAPNTAAAFAWTNTHSFAGNVTITSTAFLSANGTVGTNGQFLASNGTTVYWATPSASGSYAVKTYSRTVATTNQNVFTVSAYNSGFIDVFYNGIHLANTDFLEVNTTAIQLTSNANANDVVELVGFANVSSVTVNTAAEYTWSNAQHFYTYDLNIVNLGSGNNFNINCAAGNYFTLTCNGSVSNIYFTNAPTTRAFACVLKISNGGLNTVSYPNTIAWPSASAVTPSTNTDIYVFITDNSGTTWRGNRTMADSR